ncbi:hypothetical protein [Haliangium sp.]|uniref:hypothetical protein n=1 Tax=Haliangium sp. TaxID=2663208 RepID=UPI003D129C26
MATLESSDSIVLELLLMAPGPDSDSREGRLLSIADLRYSVQGDTKALGDISLSYHRNEISLGWRHRDGSWQQAARWTLEPTRPRRLLLHCFIRADAAPRLYVDGQLVDTIHTSYEPAPWSIGDQARLYLGSGPRGSEFPGVIVYAAVYSQLSEESRNAHAEVLRDVDVERIAAEEMEERASATRAEASATVDGCPELLAAARAEEHLSIVPFTVRSRNGRLVAKLDNGPDNRGRTGRYTLLPNGELYWGTGCTKPAGRLHADGTMSSTWVANAELMRDLEVQGDGVVLYRKRVVLTLDASGNIYLRRNSRSDDIGLQISAPAGGRRAAMFIWLYDWLAQWGAGGVTADQLFEP